MSVLLICWNLFNREVYCGGRKKNALFFFLDFCGLLLDKFSSTLSRVTAGKKEERKTHTLMIVFFFLLEDLSFVSYFACAEE